MSIIIKKIDQRASEPFPPLWKRLAVPLIGLGIMIAILCYVLYFSVEKENPETIPIIRAEPGPYRIKPENPGGRSVPHQDKLVYERLTLQEPPEYEAQFMPEGEEPIDVQQLGKEKGIGDLAKELEQSAVEEKLSTEKSSISKSENSSPSIQENQKTASAKIASSVEKKTLETHAIKVKETEVKPSTPSTEKVKRYYIQLASGKSSEILVKEWKRLQGLYPDIFRGYKPSYLRLKEEKGIYYALRVGNFSTQSLMKKFHQKLQQKKISCKMIETIEIKPKEEKGKKVWG